MTFHIGWVLLLLFITTACRQPDTANNVDAIREVLNRQVAAWNRGDLDGFFDGYWNSPELVFQSGGRKLMGWEPMRERFRETYQKDPAGMGLLEFQELEIFPLNENSSFVRGRWQLTGPGEKRAGGLFTLIIRRQPEGWKIVHDHTSS